MKNDLIVLSVACLVYIVNGGTVGAEMLLIAIYVIMIQLLVECYRYIERELE